METGELGLDEGVLDADASDHHLVEGAFLVAAGRKVQAGSGIGLRVCIDDQYLLFEHGEGGCEIDGGGGLAHAALLVRYCYDFTHIQTVE